MRRLKLRVLLTFLLPCCVLAANAKPMLHIQTWKTKSGVPVYFINAPSIPMLDLDVVFSAGSQYDGKIPGLANFTASMLSEGSAKKSANAIADQFDANGGEFAATTNRDFSNLSLRSLTAEPYWQNNFDNFLQVLSQPAFNTKDVARVKQQLLTGIKLSAQSPSTVAQNLFFKTLYANEPYAHPVIGDARSVSRINQKALKHFYTQYFVDKNAAIAMVGAVSLNQAQDIAEKIAGCLPVGKSAVSNPDNHAVKQAVTKSQDFSAKQSTVMIGQLGISPQTKDRVALAVGNFILGGPGLVSQLATELRQRRGWVYGVSSQFKLLQLKGPFVISLQTKAKQTQAAVALATQMLQKTVADGPTKQQVAFAKQSIVGSFPLAMSSNAQLSALLTGMAFYHLPLNYYDNYLANLKQVTAEQVKHAWQRAINPKKLITVVVGPEEAHG